MNVDGISPSNKECTYLLKILFELTNFEKKNKSYLIERDPFIHKNKENIYK